MTLTISNLLETVANAHALTKTLHDIRPVYNPTGRPICKCVKGVHIFEVWHNGRHALMCCSANNEEWLLRAWKRYVELADIRPECFARLTLHENELSVFDACGRGERIAVLMLPNPGQCMTINDFAVYAAETNNRLALRTAMNDLVALADGLEHRGETFDLGVGFTPAGRMIVREVGRHRPRLVEMAASLAWGLCHNHPARYTPTTEQWTERVRPLCRRLGFERRGAIDVCRTLWDLCRVDPEGLRLAMVEVCSKTELSEPTKEEPQCCDFHEGVGLIETARGFRYIDSEGRPLNHRFFEFAEPLREGRAEVATAEGWGLMDSEGKMLLPTIYEELTWNENLNTCVVMRDGLWQLLDREGRLLSRRTYEWIGEPSDGLFPVEADGHSGFIDTSGREVEMHTTHDNLMIINQ